MFTPGERTPDGSVHAWILLEGEEGEEYEKELVDEVEWTDPYYCHQN